MTDDDLYRYRATVIRVVDGDTLIVDVDAGFRWWYRGASVRVLGVNCPEPRGVTRDAGLAATARVVELVASSGAKVYVHSAEYDSFGRILGWIWLTDGRRLDEVLVGEGHGVLAARGDLRL